jgi:segregation and condensation protein B
LDIKDIESIIESVLFAAGDAVSSEKLCEIIGAEERELKIIINKMIDDYNFERRGLRIIKLEDCYQLCTRPEYYEYVQKIVEPKRFVGLSNAALEVLSIVAYEQPITRGGIEHVRGVNSDGPVIKLVEKGLIEEKGRMDVPGKPILYGTSQEFLRCFGLASLEDLPEIANHKDEETLSLF